MPFIVEADNSVIQVNMIHEYLGQVCQNVIHYYPDPTTVLLPKIDIETHYNEFVDPWLEEIMAVLPIPVVARRSTLSMWQIIEWGATPEEVVTGDQYRASKNWATPGGRASVLSSELAPPFVAVGVRKFCANQNRFTRGSWRLAGLYEEDDVSGVIDPLILGQYDVALAAFLARNPSIPIEGEIEFLTYRPVVYSFTKNFAPNTQRVNEFEVSQSTIVSLQADGNTTSQVSRKYGRGI